MFALPKEAPRFRTVTLPHVPLPMGEVMVLAVIVLIAVMGG